MHKRSNSPKWFFSSKNNWQHFHIPISPFHWAKFLKSSRVMRMCHFGSKMTHLSWTIFFGTNHYYYFHLPIGPFHCAKFKKNSYSRSRVMRMHNFWAQNGPFPQMRIFFRKPVNEPRFFHSCLSTCQKSKSDISLLVKYWWLKNIEISLAKSLFGYNLRTRFSPSMQFLQNVNEP